jgi:hypothetical protein
MAPQHAFWDLVGPAFIALSLCAAADDVGVKLRVSDAGEVSVEVTA